MKKSVKKSVKSVVKASATKSVSKRVGRPHKYSDNAKIKLLAKENPYRDNSIKGKMFALAAKASTVGGYLKAGGNMRRLLTMVKFKRVAVAG